VPKIGGLPSAKLTEVGTKVKQAKKKAKTKTKKK
tara:strand:- start:244 stop:345 length:102 start_codon:yes stop_codon:yes gene_type:complete